MDDSVLTTGGILPSPNNPMAVARRLIDDGYTHCGLPTLRYWRGDWLTWEADHWAVIHEDNVRHVLQNWLEHAKYTSTPKATRTDPNPVPEDKPWLPNTRTVNGVLDTLRTGVTLLSEREEAPSWQPTSAGDMPAGEILACQNMLLHVTTRTTYPLTPGLFNLFSAPLDYDAGAPEPTEFLAFLDSVWPDDPDSVALLQEWFGYVLSGRTDIHKILTLTGPTRSGKGTIREVLTALVGGSGNVATATLTELGERFGLAPLIGVPLTIVPDARHGADAASHIATERLLSISGGDLISADRKNQDPWKGKLTTRFMIMTNMLPQFEDASSAIADRLIHLTMTASFLDREDRGLITRLLRELPGILNWSLTGLDRLLSAGKFTEPLSSVDSNEITRALAAPVKTFLDDCTDVADVNTLLPKERLYGAWRTWCENNGIKPTSVAQFGRDIKAVRPEMRHRQTREGNMRARAWEGIKLVGKYDVYRQTQAEAASGTGAAQAEMPFD